MSRRKKKEADTVAVPAVAPPDTTAETAVAEQPPPLIRDPAREVGRLMLADALKDVGFEITRATAPVIIVEVPNVEWVAVFAVIWSEITGGPEFDEQDEDFARQVARSRGDRKLPRFFLGDRPTRQSNEVEDRRAVTQSILNHQQIIGITHDVADCLPPVLVRADPLRVVVRPPLPSMLGDVATMLTGTPWTRSPSSATSQAMDPTTLRLAVRANQTADDYLRRLDKLAPLAPTRDRTPIKLDDLPGLGEAADWARSLAKDIAAFKAGHIPWSAVDKGALVHGEPGTGKSTFARAVANECQVPLVATSYAAWQSSGDGHLGPVTKALRKTFDEAREEAPCILFIDEIDSVGTRGTQGQNQDWWRAIINGLLEQLDGLAGREGVVVIAATNNPDAIDPAVKRSGRLDRVIKIPMPGRADLEAIMRAHLADELGDVDLSPAAEEAHVAGATGADIEKWIRGARRRARHAGRPILLDDLEAEIPGNPDQRNPAVRYAIAVHEAGHALVRELLCPDTVEEVSIRPSGDIGGFVSYKYDVVLLSSEEIQIRLSCRLAGRAAEEIIFGMPSGSAGDSAASDLAQCTFEAFRAEMCLGLDGDLLWRGIDDPQQLVHVLLLRHDLAARVSARLQGAYDRALAILLPYKAMLEAIATILDHKSSLSGDELRFMINE